MVGAREQGRTLHNDEQKYHRVHGAKRELDRHAGMRTRPGVGVASSQRFRLGVASVPARPGVGVASHLLPCRPGVAAPNSSGRAGVASHLPTAGVSSGASHSEVFAFFLHPKTEPLGQTVSEASCIRSRLMSHIRKDTFDETI